MILTEIKKGQTGTGILVENDGYLSLDIPANKQLKESFGIDAPGQISLKDLPRPFVVSAVFQKFGIENANGRIYPEMALKNAVAKYMEAVNDRRGYGECNHPDGEVAIDLERLSMNIVELHWEGHTLVGKMEIPVSEAYRNYGIICCLADLIAHWLLSGLKIGVSSRGLGSVKKQFNKLIVEDDYEIVCWDVVAQPSTPSAFIGLKDSDIAPYVESQKKEGTIIKENVSNKFEKFDKWLNKK